MRILLVHNYYQQAGGEDIVLKAEYELLINHGHEVRLLTQSNEVLSNVWAKVRTFAQTHYSNTAFNLMKRELASFHPHIVHVHNFFPLFTPSIYDACKAAGVPVVQTLHNFRTLCPGALLMRGGRICEECLKGSIFHAVAHRCYRRSFVASLAVARMVDYHRKHCTWTSKVDGFIALTEFARRKFIKAGFPADKIEVKPNFTFNDSYADNNSVRNGAMFVGRLSTEKGIGTLLKAWENLSIPLRLAGDGPLRLEIDARGNHQIICLGSLTPSSVIQEMRNAAFLVVPSECLEGFPMVVAEAFACGLPVICSRLGGLAEIITDGVTGLHFVAGDHEDLKNKIEWALEHPADMQLMGKNARKKFETDYSPAENYRKLMRIYERVLG